MFIKEEKKKKRPIMALVWKAVSLAVLYHDGEGSARLLCIPLQSWGKGYPQFSEGKVAVLGLCQLPSLL